MPAERLAAALDAVLLRDEAQLGESLMHEEREIRKSPHFAALSPGHARLQK